MTEEEKKKTERNGRMPRQVLDALVRLARSTPHRMPAGGWLAGGPFAGENWRMTTIVRRYRDQATRMYQYCHPSLPSDPRDISPAG